MNTSSVADDSMVFIEHDAMLQCLSWVYPVSSIEHSVSLSFFIAA